MRNANSIVNETRVVKALRQTEVVASQVRLSFGDGGLQSGGGKNRRVVISEERVCRVCHKRLARSVVAFMPDDSVVHYGCLKRAQAQVQGQAQVTGGGGVGAGAWGRSGL